MKLEFNFTANNPANLGAKRLALNTLVFGRVYTVKRSNKGDEVIPDEVEFEEYPYVWFDQRLFKRVK